MAYIAGATSGSPHIANAISTISTFLQGNGWVLYDTVAADDLVFVSYGTGNERIFIRIKQASPYITVLAYQWWNVGTSIGYNLAGGLSGDTDVLADNTSAFSYWLWTDGRALVFATKVGSAYSGVYVGGITRNFDGGIGILSADVSLGASVSCTVDVAYPSIWTAGTKVMVLDQDLPTIAALEVGNEQATVVSSTGTTVTLALAQNHKAGALIGVDPQPVVVTEALVGIGQGATTWATNGIGVYGTIAAGVGPAYAALHPMDDSAATAALGIIGAAASPDDRRGSLLSQPIYLYKIAVGQNEIRGSLSGIFVGTPTGIGSEDTTDFALGTYIALPIGGTASRMIWIPTF